jgi:hypothetical protein
MRYKTTFVEATTKFELGDHNTRKIDKIDGEELAREIEAACELEAIDGWRLVASAPVVSGEIATGEGYTAIYSQTQGVVLTFQQDDDQAT